MVMCVASAAGLSLNMTSAQPLPAGGTVVIVWAQDNLTANPSQFSLYIVPEGPEENVIDEQLVNAGAQLSGTVTMVVPPETSLGVYDALAYTGTDSPTVGTGPALWANEFDIVAAVSSSGVSQPNSNSASQTSTSASHTSTSASQPSTSVQSPSFSSSATKAAVAPSASSVTSPPAEVGTPAKHGVATGAIAGIVVALILSVLAIGLLFFYLRRRRQTARRRFSGPQTNFPLDPSPAFAVVTPFSSSPSAPPMAQVVPNPGPIREKDPILMGSSTIMSPTATQSASGSSSGSRSATTPSAEHQEALARLEREVQLLRAQQSQNPTTYDDVPPPQYDSL